MKKSQILFWVVFSVVALLGAYTTLNFFVERLDKKTEIVGVVYDVEGIEPGQYKRFTTSQGELWVYRRSVKEIAEVNALAQYLVDPRSVDSQQPSNLRNAFRSEKEEYFVFNPITPKQGCAVKFSPASEFGYDDDYTRAPVHKYGHFREPCNGNLFDTAGRIVKIASYSGELNLTVPHIKWLSATQFQLSSQK
jgi:Rieske Fe-S protein